MSITIARAHASSTHGRSARDCGAAGGDRRFRDYGRPTIRWKRCGGERFLATSPPNCWEPFSAFGLPT
jgi:hypothetical protein